MSSEPVAAPLARRLRTASRALPATLTYRATGRGGVILDRRTTYSARLSDGHLWTLAAWAEISGRDPIVTYRVRQNSPDRAAINPWQAGADSAWAYLRQQATAVIGGAEARQLIARLEGAAS